MTQNIASVKKNITKVNNNKLSIIHLYMNSHISKKLTLGSFKSMQTSVQFWIQKRSQIHSEIGKTLSGTPTKF